jgi:hypothetical protein
MSNRGKGAFGRGFDAAADAWDWRWLLAILVAVAVLGRLLQELGLL